MSFEILLVEDETDLAFTLQTRLELAGLVVSSVGSGEAALRRLADNAPQVVLLDLRLPDIDGFEVLKQVRATHPDLPVVILSAHSSEWQVREAARLGATAYLTKPVDLGELEGTLRRVVRDASA